MAREGGHGSVHSGGVHAGAAQPLLLRALIQHHRAQMGGPIHHTHAPLHHQISENELVSGFDDPNPLYSPDAEPIPLVKQCQLHCSAARPEMRKDCLHIVKQICCTLYFIMSA